MKALIAFAKAELRARADAEKARAMQAYMKTAMPFYGVQAAPRRRIVREAQRRFPIRTRCDYEAAVTGLWALPHREEKYAAIELAALWAEFVGQESLGLYERMIREGAWWDFVDEVAAHLVGGALAKSPDDVWPVVDRWIDDPDMWIRRSALVCQLTLKARTDATRLFDYCLRRAGEREFFIRKAIGWALRQYSYVAPGDVKRFLATHGRELSPLSCREAARVLRKKEGRLVTPSERKVAKNAKIAKKKEKKRET